MKPSGRGGACARTAKPDPSPGTPAERCARFLDRINGLELDSLAHMGRLGYVEGTLELVEYPYLIIYLVDEARREVVVLSIVHGAQNREDRTF